MQATIDEQIESLIEHIAQTCDQSNLILLAKISRRLTTIEVDNCMNHKADVLKSTDALFGMEFLSDDQIIVVEDLNGKISVTNDIENVCALCVADLGNYPIIYSDSTGQFDQAKHDHGKFIGFEILGCTKLQDAIEKVNGCTGETSP